MIEAESRFSRFISVSFFLYLRISFSRNSPYFCAHHLLCIAVHLHLGAQRDEKQVAALKALAEQPADFASLAARTSKSISLWQNLPINDASFRASVLEISQVCGVAEGDKKLIAIVLVLCKIARLPLTNATALRKTQAISLLDYMMRRLPSADESGDGAAAAASASGSAVVSPKNSHATPSGLLFVYRRVAIHTVCSCLDSSAPDSTFAVCLSLLSTAWKRFLRVLHRELGIVFYTVLLEQLQLSGTQPLRRIAILYVFLGVLKNSRTAVDACFNFDGHSDTPLIERLVKVLCALLDECAISGQNADQKATSDTIRNHALSLLLELVEFVYEFTESARETEARKNQVRRLVCSGKSLDAISWICFADSSLSQFYLTCFDALPWPCFIL